MDEKTFAMGYDVDTYVRTIRNYRSFVRDRVNEADADELHAAMLRERATSNAQPVRATIMTEDWCGDSALNLPVLANLFSRAGIEFRVFRGSEHEQLKTRYEADGTDHIPVVSLWDGNGEEIGRWVEAPAAMEQKKEAWKAERPRFMELYAKQGEDKDAAKEFAALYREFMEQMAEWYRDGMWRETTREVAELL